MNFLEELKHVANDILTEDARVLIENRKQFWDALLQDFVKEATLRYDIARQGRPPVKIDINMSLTQRDGVGNFVCDVRVWVDWLLVYRTVRSAPTPLEAEVDAKKELVMYMMTYGLGQAHQWIYEHEQKAFPYNPIYKP